MIERSGRKLFAVSNGSSQLCIFFSLFFSLAQNGYTCFDDGRCSLRHPNIICVYGSAFAGDELWLIMDLAEAGTASSFLEWLRVQEGCQSLDKAVHGGQGYSESLPDSLPDNPPDMMRDPSNWSMFTAEDATPQARLELALGTARAIQHLHDNKVQHRYWRLNLIFYQSCLLRAFVGIFFWLHYVYRDLKSHNILLSRDATGKLIARVSDFGLSRAQVNIWRR